MNKTPDNKFPRPLRVLGGKALERLLNHALALDPDAALRLAKLEGKTVELHLDGPDLGLEARVVGGTLQVGPIRECADIRVRTTPGVVLTMALDRGHELAPGKLEIAGDAGLARQVESLLKGFHPDLEALLAERVGDVAGVPLARALKGFARGFGRAASHAGEDAAAWVRDESRLVPARAEMEDWLDGVDAAAERSERLMQRVKRLESGQ